MTSKSIPLIEACAKGDVATVQDILTKGTDIHETDNEGKSALHHCVDINLNTQCASLLLEFSHALLEKVDSAGFTTLQLACMTGNSDLAQLLVDHGANLNAADNEKHTPLHWAVICCQFSCVDVLIRNGVKLSLADKHGASPLHYVTRVLKNAETSNFAPAILYRLLDNGAPVDSIDNEGRTPLFWAAGFGLLECCNLLIKAGASLNHRDTDGLTLLHCAVSKGQMEMVSFLMEYKQLNVDCVDQNGCTPLFYAITFNYFDVVGLLLSRGSDPNHKDNNGFTPAHCAAIQGNVEILTKLKDMGGLMWAKNSTLDTPLHEACESGSLALAQFLINCAKEEGKMHFLNEKNCNRYSCLHLASESGTVAMCELLINNGAEINAIITFGESDTGGFTPLDLAANSACRNLLLSKGGHSGIAEDLGGYTSGENDEIIATDVHVSGKERKISEANAKSATSRSVSRKKSFKKQTTSKKSENHSGRKGDKSPTFTSVLSAQKSISNSKINNEKFNKLAVMETDVEQLSANSEFLAPIQKSSQNKSENETKSTLDMQIPKKILDRSIRYDTKEKKNTTLINQNSTGYPPSIQNNEYESTSKENNTKSRLSRRSRKAETYPRRRIERHKHLPPLHLVKDGRSSYPSSDSSSGGILPPKLTRAQTIAQSVLEFEGLRISTRDITEKRRKERYSDHSVTNNFAQRAVHGNVTSMYTNLNSNRATMKPIKNDVTLQTHDENSSRTDRSCKSNLNGTSPSRLTPDESSVYFNLSRMTPGPSTDDRRRVFELKSSLQSHKKDESGARLLSSEMRRHERLKKAYAPLIPMDDLIALFQ